MALRDFGQEDLGGFMNHSKNSDLGLNFGNTVDDSKINPYRLDSCPFPRRAGFFIHEKYLANTKKP